MNAVRNEDHTGCVADTAATDLAARCECGGWRVLETLGEWAAQASVPELAHALGQAEARAEYWQAVASEVENTTSAGHVTDTATRVFHDGTGYAIRIGYTVTDDDVRQVMESAADVIGHWARDLSPNDDSTWRVIEALDDGTDDGHGDVRHDVSPRDIAGAIASILDGSVKCNADIVRNLREFVAALDYCDGETGDVVLQVAVFGDITYG